MAELSVHPVPWVFLVSMRCAGSSTMRSPSNSRSTRSLPGRWPPFSSTQRSEDKGSSSRRRSAARYISLTVSGARCSSSTPASGRLGVIRKACGNSASRIAEIALFASRLSPLLATMTGSSTTFAARQCARRSATVVVTSALPSMPILLAWMATSANRVSICRRRKSVGGTCTPVTAWVFCAVSAAITPQP